MAVNEVFTVTVEMMVEEETLKRLVPILKKFVLCEKEKLQEGKK